MLLWKGTAQTVDLVLKEGAQKMLTWIKQHKSIIKTLGDRLSFAIVINFYIWLGVAMLHEGQVTIYFNEYNEAFIEYIIYFSILPIIIYALYVDVKEFRRKRKCQRGVSIK